MKKEKNSENKSKPQWSIITKVNIEAKDPKREVYIIEILNLSSDTKKNYIHCQMKRGKLIQERKGRRVGKDSVKFHLLYILICDEKIVELIQ